MRRILLILLILAFGIDSADARRRKHRHHHRYQPSMYVVPNAPAAMTPGAPERGLPPMRSGPTTRAAPDGPTRYVYGSPAELVPPDWQLQPPDPNWKGKRYRSPDGTAWFDIYATPVEGTSIAVHMKTIAFVDGEEITYLRGERTWIAVAGAKGDRLFYRKAVLACAGKRWHQVAFEYPADAKRSLDEFVNRAAEAVHNSQNDSCDSAVSATR